MIITKANEAIMPVAKPSIPGTTAFTPNREIQSSVTATMPGHTLNLREVVSGVVIGLLYFSRARIVSLFTISIGRLKRAGGVFSYTRPVLRQHSRLCSIEFIRSLRFSQRTARFFSLAAPA